MRASVTLRTAIGTFGHTRALKDGRVVPAGFALEHVEVNPMIAAYRRMVRDNEFDVCEMAPTTYLVAKAYGKPFTGVPIFLNRRFHHEDIFCRNAAHIAQPADLRGKRVGVRAYTVTTGVWARGILQHEYGVLPEEIHWVTDDEEHVAEFPIPANVTAAAPGRTLADLFAAGEIDAAFTGPAGVGGKHGSVNAPHMHPLFPDAAELQRAWYERTGIYPMHAMIVIKDDVLRAHPSLPAALMDAFTAAKNLWLDELQTGAPQDHEGARLASFQPFVGRDVLPYGVAANRAGIDALLAYAEEQRLIPRRAPLEELFSPC